MLAKTNIRLLHSDNDAFSKHIFFLKNRQFFEDETEERKQKTILSSSDVMPNLEDVKYTE